MDLNIDHLTSKNYVKPIKKPLAKGERSAEGGMWGVTVIPVAGLFMELYANDRYSGAALWLTVLILIWFGCYADFRQISPSLSEEKAEKLRKLLPIPPAYIFTRDEMRKGEGYRGVVLGILMAAAIFGNGFTQGLMINKNTLPDKLKNASVTALSNFRGTSDNVIGKQLTAWFDDGYDTECSKDGSKFTIEYSGKHAEKSASVTIEVVHDGFAYKSLKAADVTIDGKKLDGDERRDALKEIFIGNDEEGSSSLTTDSEDSTESIETDETSEKEE